MNNFISVTNNGICRLAASSSYEKKNRMIYHIIDFLFNVLLLLLVEDQVRVLLVEVVYFLLVVLQHLQLLLISQLYV